MNELESLLQLNKMLLAESPQYLAQAAAFPPDAEAQWRLFRSLVNVRAPRPAGGDFLALQDSLLQKITACKGVTAFHSLTPMQTSTVPTAPIARQIQHAAERNA